jgi:phytoene dehydrogenase-like protein
LTRRASAYDVVVVGGGHNGLVCAAYLAGSGLRVVVLERRANVGGMAETSELLPGIQVPTLAHTVGRLKPSVARDLKLRRHGLALVQPQVRVFAPQPDGRSLTLWVDAARTAAELQGSGLASAADAEGYLKANVRLRALASALSALHEGVPPDLAAPSLSGTLGAVRTGLAARARSRSADVGLLRTLPMSVADLVADWFESDALRAVIAARGMLLTRFGPRMPGTAAVLLTDSAGNDGGLAGQTVFARGGPGALSAALASAARSAGAEIRASAEVAHVRRSGEAVLGVTLAGGEEIDAAVVVSGLDPKTTLLSLIDPEALGPRLSWRASNIRQSGVTAKVNFALRGLPVFPAAQGDTKRLRGRILLSPSMSALDRAADPAKYGDVSEEPLIEATIPSLIDPSLVEGQRRGKVKHVMSAIVQSAPYDLREGTWSERRDALGDIAMRTIENYAPGFAGLVEAREVMTPLDIERGYGAAGGHPMHAEVGLDQWFEWRPLHGLGRYRMPLDGLYLCGSGAHPGGGITGAPGQLAAREIITDVRAGRIRVGT